MKSNLFKIIAIAAVLTIVSITTVFAAPSSGSIPGAEDFGVTQAIGSENVSGIVDLITAAFRWMYTIFFIIAGIMILFAAFTYLMSGGDSEKVTKAKNEIIYAVVAIVVALLAVSINMIVKSFVSNQQ